MSRKKLTVTEVGQLMKVSQTTVRNWKRDGMPMNADRETTTENKVRKWLTEREERRKQKIGSNPELQAAKIRREELKIEREELELAILRGEKIDLADLKGMLVERAKEFRQALVAQVVERVPAMFPEVATELEAALQAAVDGVLRHYSRPDPVTKGLASYGATEA